MVRMALGEMWSGLGGGLIILHIPPLTGKNLGGLPTSYWSPLSWIYSSIVFLIPDMSWLNSALKYSGVSNFSVQYICMSIVPIFCIIFCAINFPFLSTPHDDVTGKILKGYFIKMQRKWIFIQIIETMVQHAFTSPPPLQSYPTHKHHLRNLLPHMSK